MAGGAMSGTAEGGVPDDVDGAIEVDDGGLTGWPVSPVAVEGVVDGAIEGAAGDGASARLEAVMPISAPLRPPARAAWRLLAGVAVAPVGAIRGAAAGA